MTESILGAGNNASANRSTVILWSNEPTAATARAIAELESGADLPIYASVDEMTKALGEEEAREILGRKL